MYTTPFISLLLFVYGYFEKGCWKKEHAPILKAIVGGFEFTVLQRNLKEWRERPLKYVFEF